MKVIPAVYWKKILRDSDSIIPFVQEQLEAWGTAIVLDFWRFRLEDISFNFTKQNMENSFMNFSIGQMESHWKDFVIT